LFIPLLGSAVAARKAEIRASLPDFRYIDKFEINMRVVAIQYKKVLCMASLCLGFAIKYSFKPDEDNRTYGTANQDTRHHSPSSTTSRTV
jgi:hypothetical protein